MGLAYVCEHSVAKPKTCDFRSGRIILQQEILPEQMIKLLNEGKTDLLPGFVSQRTRRPFKAYLAKGKDGKVSFEFEPRKAKPPGKGAAVADADSGDEAVDATATKTVAAKPAKPASTKVVTKKPAAKKIATKAVAAPAAVKKPVLKKVVAKKAAAKKVAAKKTAVRKTA
jgi:DNA topoisomerase-3